MPNDLLSAWVHLICGPLATVRLQVKAGKLRILAVISAQWPAFASAVPTMAQAGVPNVGCMAWLCFFVPTGTPKDVTGRLCREPMKVLCQPDATDVLTRVGLELPAVAADEAMVLFDGSVERGHQTPGRDRQACLHEGRMTTFKGVSKCRTDP